jgi:hypothetical protein
VQPGLAHLLTVSAGSEAQARLPQSLAAEAVGAAAALTWCKVLLGMVGDGGGSGSCVTHMAEGQLRQVRCKPRCPRFLARVARAPIVAGCRLNWLSKPLACLTHCFMYTYTYALTAWNVLCLARVIQTWPASFGGRPSHNRLMHTTAPSFDSGGRRVGSRGQVNTHAHKKCADSVVGCGAGLEHPSCFGYVLRGT